MPPPPLPDDPDAAAEYLQANGAGGDPQAQFEILLRGLAHKMNNQISVAHGFTSLLLMQDNLDAATRESVQHVKEASTQMVALLNRVLLLAGSGMIRPTSVDVAALLAGLNRPLRELAHARSVGFAQSAAPELPRVHADPARLREILLELTRNATDAAEGCGQVAFDVLPETGGGANHVAFYVRNTGSSWNDDGIRRAFEPFHSTKGSEHPGLGLPCAAKLASLMGGDLAVRHVNGTTTARLRLPAV